MTGTTHITYLFDPLCGWCYGASPVMEKLSTLREYSVELAPTGLFAGKGARSVDSAFAAFAWANDQRIAQATGQPFSEDYRRNVLGDEKLPFDSGPATIALTAVAITAPERELEALQAIQHYRYVIGCDNTSLVALAHVLRELKLHDAAESLASPDDALVAALQRRIDRAREHMRQFRVAGVPALIVGSGDQSRVVRANALFDGIEALLLELSATRHHLSPVRAGGG